MNNDDSLSVVHISCFTFVQVFWAFAVRAMNKLMIAKMKCISSALFSWLENNLTQVPNFVFDPEPYRRPTHTQSQMVQKKIRRKCIINNSHWNELRIIFKKKEEKNVLFGPFDVSYTLYATRQPSHHSPLKWKCSFGCHQINQSALWSRKKERERRREKHPIPDEMKNKLYESKSICWECVCVAVCALWIEKSRAESVTVMLDGARYIPSTQHTTKNCV